MRGKEKTPEAYVDINLPPSPIIIRGGKLLFLEDKIDLLEQFK